jgi:hypothetical protein
MSQHRSDPSQSEAEARLQAVSPSFCPSKWNDAYLHLHKGTSHACHYPTAHEVSPEAIRENPAALHNTPDLLAARQEMLRGTRPSECSYCWKIEDLGQISPRLRQTKNEWSEEKIAAILQDPLSGQHRPQNLEIGFSRACNFACVYCSPAFSSRWVSELKKHGPISAREHLSQDQYLEEKFSDDENPYVAAFEKWFPQLQESLVRFGITGGEPLLSPHTFRLLDRLFEHPAPQLDLHINSNLGAPRAAIEDLVGRLKPLLAEKKIRSFKLYTSLESYGARAEYARFGLHWENFWQNLGYVLEELPEATAGVMSTFNLLSVSSFPEFLAKLLEWRQRYAREKNRITLSPNYLREPDFLSAQLCPESLRPHLTRALDFVRANRNNLPGKKEYGFLQSELSRLEALVAWANRPAADHPIQQMRLYAYFKKLDERRGTDFLATFPELAEYWKEGERLACFGGHRGSGADRQVHVEG